MAELSFEEAVSRFINISPLSSSGSDSCNDSCLGYSEVENDELAQKDQKRLNLIREELEKWNTASDQVNKLVVELDVARAVYREQYDSWTKNMRNLSEAYKSAIEKARPYYEAKLEKQKIAEDLDRSFVRSEEAKLTLDGVNHQVTRTVLSLGVVSDSVRTESLEFLNQINERAKEATKEREAAQEEHRKNSARMEEISGRITELHEDYRSSIEVVNNYFRNHRYSIEQLEKQKQLVQGLETDVATSKAQFLYPS